MNGKRPLRIGVLGGIGGGKSTVARMLSQRGAAIVDADRIGHEVLQHKDVQSRLAALLGDDIFDQCGNVDRRRVASKVFGRPQTLRRFNAIVHPPLLAEFQRQIEEAEKKRPPAIVLDAALLMEWGLDRLCDVMIFVDAPEELRARRAKAARGWSLDELRRREAAQTPLDEKRKAADFVIRNDGDLEALDQQVQEFWTRFVEIS